MIYGDITPVCPGATHVVPVPSGMTAEESWEEIATFGRLLDPDASCAWAVVECEGGPDCSCLHTELSPTFKRYHNDVLVFDATDPDHRGADR